jgi:hypothetical protein
MNEVQKKLDNELTDLEDIMYKLDDIDDNEFNNIYVKLKNYENNIKKINSTIKKISLLKDNLNVVINNYILKKVTKKNIYQFNSDVSYKGDNNKNKKLENINKHIKNDVKIKYKNVTNEERYNNYSFTKFAVIDISEKDLDLVENAPIYYINETQQYCIKINNNIIMGNIANIFNKNENSKQDITKVTKCKNTNCNGIFYNKLCKFYHEGENRNFTNYSWNHISKNKLGKCNLKNNILNFKKYDLDNTRFIGSLDTLVEDLPFSSNNEKKLRSGQLMHDILLYMILSEYLC